tara:strand:- start:11132 stop:11806 length:675 start_codon:yes stop_codon:yes gene_type:complete
MYADRMIRALARRWLFVMAIPLIVSVVTVSQSYFDGITYLGRAEVLVAAKIPSQFESKYDVEISRTTAADFVVDDLQRIAGGSEFAVLTAEKLKEDELDVVNVGSLVGMIEGRRSHRGLSLIVRHSNQREALAISRAAATVMIEDIELLFPTVYRLASITIIDLAVVPDNPQRLNDMINLIIRFVGALGVSASIAILWDNWRDKLYAGDIEDELGLRLLVKFDV